MPAVRDQGALGSCVAFASTEMKTAQEVKDIQLKKVFSPLFIYWQRTNEGEGMYLRDAMKILTDAGVCSEEKIPYEQRLRSRDTVPEYAKDEAKNYVIQAYARLTTVDEMRKALVEYGPFIIAIPVYESFSATPSSGIVPIPDTTKEKVIGGHALCVVGYDDEQKCFKIKNSWGKDWGASGYGYLTYDFICAFLWDAWSSVDAPSKKPTWFSQLWTKIFAGFVRVDPMIFVFILLVIGMIIYALYNK